MQDPFCCLEVRARLSGRGYGRCPVPIARRKCPQKPRACPGPVGLDRTLFTRRLEKLVLKVMDGWLRYSESFTDGAKLLAAAEHMGLEGVVSKMWVNIYRTRRGRTRGLT